LFPDGLRSPVAGASPDADLDQNPESHELAELAKRSVAIQLEEYPVVGILHRLFATKVVSEPGNAVVEESANLLLVRRNGKHRRGILIGGQVAHGDSFRDDRHPDLKADFILANPPFNVSDWGGEHLVEDKRWRYGVPPKGNANFAWVQHMVHHLTPRGIAGFVLANGSMSSQQSGEGEIRKNLIEAELVDCMVALPGQLFYSTQIPACLWFLARGRRRRGQILFIDARKLGRMVDRTHRELTGEEVARIADTYHAWRDEDGYSDIPGFCKSAALDEVRKHGHVLTPGRYVGVEPQEDDGEPFEEKMKPLVAELREQQAEGARLDAAITANLNALGFGGRDL